MFRDIYSEKISGHRNVCKTTNLSGNLTLTGGVLHSDCHRLCNEKQLWAQDETTWWSMCRLARGCHIGKVGDPGWKDLSGSQRWHWKIHAKWTCKSCKWKNQPNGGFSTAMFDYGTGEPFQNAGFTPPRWLDTWQLLPCSWYTDVELQYVPYVRAFLCHIYIYTIDCSWFLGPQPV